MKGLKQMVSEALTEEQAPEPVPVPVTVSGDAVQALAVKMREWSGWPNSRTISGDPTRLGSPFAACDHTTRTFMFNPDRLVLNPNRVLLTVTPFRLRQEAVLTGALLHEAGHARHSHWLPRTEEEAKAKPLLHGDGTVPTQQCVKLARLMEEPRVEGLMARDADRIGASTLGWTMRAAAAHLVPVTSLSTDPSQAVMDLITSWTLRAGRQYAIEHWTNHRLRGWVQDFTSLLHGAILTHLSDREAKGADIDASVDTGKIINALITMTALTDDTGPSMIDWARTVLDLLFPETPDDDSDDEQPMPGEGCSSDETSEEEQETAQSEQSEQSEAGPEEDAGAPENDAEAGDGGEGDEPGSEDGEGDSGPKDEGASGEPGEGTASGDGEDEGEGASDSTGPDSDTDTDTDSDSDSPLAKALADMEQKAKAQTKDEVVEEEAEQGEDESVPGGSASHGAGGPGGGGWRHPNKEERDIQKGAERFLRNLIDMSESSKVSLTDTPSSTVDGGALAAWKAGGQHSSPHFFIRTHREAVPSPPVKVAVLVDISSSMDELQKPSAVLSWALAAAALDLRNFAGRGQQIESCLIHWGNSARVIQPAGAMLPGIKEHACNEGTSNMHGALALIEEQMPGFFDITEQPVNRLIVQFTDWELYGGLGATKDWLSRAFESGVNMLTVAPRDYSARRSELANVLKACPVQRGSATLLKYNPLFPQQVWEQAAEALV